MMAGPLGSCRFVSTFWIMLSISLCGVSSLKEGWSGSVLRRICLSLIAALVLVLSFQ